MSGQGDGGVCEGQEQPGKVETYMRPLKSLFL